MKLTNHPLNKEKYPYVVSVASTEREYYLCADNDTTRILWHDTMVQVVKAAQEADHLMFLNMPVRLSAVCIFSLSCFVVFILFCLFFFMLSFLSNCVVNKH